MDAAARTVRAQATDTTRDGRSKDWNFDAGRLGSVRLQIAFLYDLNVYGQRAASVAQVGPLAKTGRVRTDRIILEGTLGHAREPWRYLFSVDYDGLQADVSTAFTMNDLALSIPLGRGAWVSLGRQKEGISEEMLASTRTLPHVERSAAVLAFIPTRNDGVRLWGTIATTSAGRGGWTIGLFNSCLFNGLSPAANGEQVSGRVFWAPFVSADTVHVIQLALSGRWTDDQDGTLRFRAKPEVDEAPDFANTGRIPSSGATLGDASVLMQQGSISLTAEALPVHVRAAQPRSLSFGGSYVELAWRPRGEPRSYDEETGSLGRVRLERHRFAIEIGVRYTNADLSNGAVDGGVFDRTSAGVTWYGPYNLRAQLDYGYALLNKGGVVGRTNLLTTRFQWEVR